MPAPTEQTFSYYVVMIDYGRRGREAIVDPEVTRRGVIDRIRTGEYPRSQIAFIHYVTMNDVPQDVTQEFLHCSKWGDHETEATPLAAAFDHARDLAKHSQAAE